MSKQGFFFILIASILMFLKKLQKIQQSLQCAKITFYSETWLNQTLNKLESCKNQTLDKVQIKDFFVNLTYMYTDT
jgi:hypothetical protein